jgi:hypothetical protein
VADNRGNLRGSASASGTGVQGAEDFLALSKALKAAGKAGLRKELHKAVAAAAKPLLPKVKEAARTSLPRAGGLNQRIARKPIRVQARTGEKTAGVRIVGSKVDPRINQGRVGHPIFGRKGKPKNGGKNWAVQNVPGAVGYFDKTIEEGAPGVQGSVAQVLEDFAARIIAEAR